MEEDIKILESECYYLEELGYLRENNHFIRFNQALKNLIKGYRELEEKYNNELDEGLRMSEWLVQKQKQIEELEYRYNKALSDLSIDAHKLNESQYIIKLKDEEYRNIVDIIQKDSIPKSKIKEKLEELESKIKATFCKYMTEEDYYNNKFLSSDVAEDYEVLEVRKLISNRNLLQELMEDK